MGMQFIDSDTAKVNNLTTTRSRWRLPSGGARRAEHGRVRGVSIVGRNR